MLTVSYDRVLSTLCLCDVVAYLKAKDGKVVFPGEHAGKKLEEVVAALRGVRLAAEKDGYLHLFVVRPSAAEKLTKPPALEKTSKLVKISA